MQTPQKPEIAPQVPLEVIRANFILYDHTPSKWRTNSRCKWCQGAFDQDPSRNPPAAILRGRRETWTRHLNSCPKYKGEPEPEPFVAPATWSTSRVDTFEGYVVEFQQYHKLPDTFAKAPVTKRLWDFLAPGVVHRLPSRKQLGGRLLARTADSYASQDKAELLALAEALRGRVNLVSDGWMAINRNHVNAFQLTMFGKVHTYAVIPVGARHDAVVIAKQIEEVLMQAKAEGWSNRCYPDR